MGLFFGIWCGLLSGVALIWASRHISVSRAQRSEHPLTSRSFDAPPRPAPRVSVLVAAKDEEANIAACVSTLLTQDYPDFEVIAVNDRSTDRTPQILDDLAARHPGRLQVIHVRHLREGWFGKNNAMREGVERATGSWLMFTDADCRQISNRTLAVTMRYAQQERADLLSVLPVLEMGSFWERVIQPVCTAIMALWFDPRRVNRPESRAAYANGAFMLMTRDLYDCIGGHEQVKNQVNEDMHMARRTKQVGRRLCVVQNDDLYRTRMYTGLAESWRGWSRIFYGCFGSFRRLIISTLVLSLASLLPWVSLVAGAAGLLASGGAHWKWVTVLAAVTIVLQLSVLVRFYRLCKNDPWLVPTYPVGAFIALGMLLNAMLKLAGRTTTWRGTTYRGTALARTAGRPGETPVLPEAPADAAGPRPAGGGLQGDSLAR